MQLQWRNCEEVEQEHKKDIRQYAHTYHYPNVICVCAAFWELPKKYRDGILLHEIGHLIVGPRGSEAEATAAAEAFFGAEIRYVDSPYGRELERLSNMARARLRRNPGPDDLPYGEWIPTHAVKFNHDGTVSLMAEPAANRGRRRNAHYGRRGELEFVPERLKADLMNLWHLSRTAEGSDELARIDWTVDEFHKEHPELTHSQIFRDLSAML